MINLQLICVLCVVVHVVADKCQWLNNYVGRCWDFWLSFTSLIWNKKSTLTGISAHSSTYWQVQLLNRRGWLLYGGSKMTSSLINKTIKHHIVTYIERNKYTWIAKSTKWSMLKSIEINNKMHKKWMDK